MGTSEQIDAHKTQPSSFSSSSIESSNYPSGTPPPSSSSSTSLSSIFRNSSNTKRNDLTTDLRLGLSISQSSQTELAFNSTPREHTYDWPPTKSILRSTLVEKQNGLSKSTLKAIPYVEN